MTSRYVLPVMMSAALLAGCSGGSSPTAAGGPGSAPSTRSAGSGTTSSSAASTGAPAAAAQRAAAAASARAAAPSAPGAGAPTEPGTAITPTRSTAPGSYTYDNSGTVTAGTPHDAAGTSTLTVDAPAAGRQHSVLASDQGRTEQDVVAGGDGTYLARLVLSNQAFTKDFRPASPVLLVPDPAAPGRSWSWTATSTDGKTTAAVTSRIDRHETLTIGGARTLTSVVTSTLKVTGDVTYTAQLGTWYDATDRLTAKEHTKGSGTVSGFAFSTDITSILRSTRPS